MSNHSPITRVIDSLIKIRSQQALWESFDDTDQVLVHELSAEEVLDILDSLLIQPSVTDKESR